MFLEEQQKNFSEGTCLRLTIEGFLDWMLGVSEGNLKDPLDIKAENPEILNNHKAEN